jgi:alkylhydroperoxidase/carboxymuconolactone decarboxylase family protein YurZ
MKGNNVMKTIFTGILFALFCIFQNMEAKTMGKNVLTTKEQKLAAIAAYSAKGDLAGLKNALAVGLDAGLTVNEIKEILVQSYAYCGFPRSLNALGTFMALVNERGNKDTEGKLPSPLPKGKSIDFGTENQTKLCGAPVTGALFDFAPAIDEYLKAHLFGDIFARDNVSWKTRELATLAMLAVIPGAEPQLKAHVGIAKNNGLTDEQIEAILAIARPVASPDVFPKGDILKDFFTGGDVRCAMLIVNKENDLSVYNVTFSPGARTKWHKHAVGQQLLCTVGTGYYQERGKRARKLQPGAIVEIPANTDHWHGASPDSEFVHIGTTAKMSDNKVIWLEPVSDKDYNAATSGK